MCAVLHVAWGCGRQLAAQQLFAALPRRHVISIPPPHPPTSPALLLLPSCCPHHHTAPTHPSQVNAGFFYSSAEQREKLVAAERAVVDEKVQRVIDLKKQVGPGFEGG